MKESSSFEANVVRINIWKQTLLGLFFSITSLPRLSLEVFVRRRFGRDYFNRSSVFTVLVILSVWPIIFFKNGFFYGIGDFLLHFTTWYVYLAAFLYKSWHHYREIKSRPGEFDFDLISHYSGDQDRWYDRLSFVPKKVSNKLVATLLEPGLFFAIGLILSLMKQPIGYVFILHSIIYSLGYEGAFLIGHMNAQQAINSMIYNQELGEVCIDGKYPDSDKGFEFFEMPQNAEHRRKMANFMSGNEEFSEAY